METTYNEKDYSISLKYEDLWKKYIVEVTDNKGNTCELWFKEDYSKFYIQFFYHASGKYMRKTIDGGLTTSRSKLSYKEYETVSHFNKYVTDNKDVIFKLVRSEMEL